MKVHPPIFRSVVRALGEIFEEGRNADQVIEFHSKSNKVWGGRDRRQFAELVYDCVRWYRRLEFSVRENKKADGNPEENQGKSVVPYVQLMMLVKGWESTKEDVKGRPLLKKALVRWKAVEGGAIYHSVPDWLYELGKKEVEAWDECLEEMNKVAPVFLRSNPLKIERTSLIERLKSEGVEVEEVPEGGVDALQLVQRQNVFRTESFKMGAFEMQDLSSQQVAPFLEVEPGQRVIDACAGAGGKTLHLGAILQNKGRLIALDIHEWKLKELKKRARRAGVDTVECRLIENQKTIKRLKDSADRLLLDVPCSGLGVLRRNPDAKWKLDKEFVQRVHSLQEKLLNDYSKMLKPDGKMVYSTCSILPSENQNQVQRFLSSEEGSSFTLEEEKSIPPKRGDGFYMARLKRVK